MSSLQAQSRTAACPFFKLNHDASCKTCSVHVLMEKFCADIQLHINTNKNPNNTQNQNY